MSASRRLRDFLDGGFGKRRREAFKAIEENAEGAITDTEALRPILNQVLVNPDQVKEMFDLVMTNEITRIHEGINTLKGLKDNEDGRPYVSDISQNVDNLMLFAYIEAVGISQHRIGSMLFELIKTLESKTMSKEEVATKLESIKREFALPEVDKKNIEWVRKYLEHASKV